MSDVKPVLLQVLAVFRKKDWVDYDGTALFISRLISEDRLTKGALSKVAESFFLFNKISKQTLLNAVMGISSEDITMNVQSQVDVLILTASPKFAEPRIRVDKEYKSIIKRIRSTTRRDSFNIQLLPAVERGDLIDEINRVKPVILQLSAHGGKYSLLLEGDSEEEAELSAEQLEAIISTAVPFLKVVILNSCESSIQAEILLAHVDIAIGMVDEIGDKSAIDFSTQFYSSLAEGRSVEAAFNQAVIAVGFKSAANATVPALYVRKGIDASGYTLL